MDFSHRLSRTLGYDGMRAEKKAAYEPPNESREHEKRESPARERREHSTGRELGYDGEKKESLIEKAIRRAKAFIKPKPTPTAEKKRPPTGQKKFLDRKLNPDTGELEEKPESPVKLGDDGKVGKVMHEFKHGQLHSGSKSGPKVTNRKQAIAIGMSEARKTK